MIDTSNRRLPNRARPVVLVISKVDLVNKARLLPLMEQYLRLFPWTEIVPVSAQTADNTDRLLTVTVSLLDEGEATYDEDMITDQSMRTLAAEFIRGRRFCNRPMRRSRIRSRWRSKSLWKPRS